MSIDYARMSRTAPRLKAALTRAVKSGSPSAIRGACHKAVQEWDAIGAWPDNWHNWERALHDAGFRLPLEDA